MGDPRSIGKKYSKPLHPWRAERISSEKKLVTEFGLKNKTEIWRLQSKLKTFIAKARQLIAAIGPQADKERTQLLSRLARMGLIAPNAGLDDVLGLKLPDFLNRRLQTVLVKKGLARTPGQARQLINHEHITVSGKTVSSPSYLVSLSDETAIAFVPGSNFANPEHVERISTTTRAKQVKA